MKFFISVIFLFMQLSLFSAAKENELFDAVICNNIPAVKKLIRSGTYLNAQNSEGLTAYRMAEINNFTVTARLLADAGAVFPSFPDNRQVRKIIVLKGLLITFNAYSGKSDPQWWMTHGSDFRNICSILKNLKFTAQPLFDYQKLQDNPESFIIESSNLTGLYEVYHICGDKICMQCAETLYYAVNARPAYDILCRNAAEKGLEVFNAAGQ